jgi:hypothetical protein
MDEAAAAAEWMRTAGFPGFIERVLLTGLIVTYGRPFTSQGVGTIDHRKFAPSDPDARRLHERLLYERRRRFAHTDETPGRFIAENVRDFMGISVEHMGIEPGSAVEFVVETLARNELPAVAALAKKQAKRFRAEAAKARAAAPDAGGKSSGRRLTGRGVEPQVVISDPDDEDEAAG